MKIIVEIILKSGGMLTLATNEVGPNLKGVTLTAITQNQEDQAELILNAEETAKLATFLNVVI